MKKLSVFIILINLLFIVKLSFTFASAPINNYLQFQGGYVQADSNIAYSPPAVTFEMWIRPEKVSGKIPIVSVGNPDLSKFHYELGINGGSFYLDYTYGTNSYRYITTGQIENNVWSHLSAVISSATTKLFINGSQIFSSSGVSNLSPVGNIIVLGKNYQLSPFSLEVYKGDLDELRISASVRDIVNNWNSGVYNSPLAGDAETMILWHFDENRGSLQSFDSSSNNVTGALVGGDMKIHFFGTLPTPTKFVLPTLRPINWPYNYPRPTQGQINPPPNPSPSSYFFRYDRPVWNR